MPSQTNASPSDGDGEKPNDAQDDPVNPVPSDKASSQEDEPVLSEIETNENSEEGKEEDTSGVVGEGKEEDPLEDHVSAGDDEEEGTVSGKGGGGVAGEIPKRPPNAYMAFVKENFAKFREANPDIHHKEVSRKVAEAYREMGDEEKKRYKDAADAARAKYKEEYGQAAFKHHRKSKKRKRKESTENEYFTEPKLPGKDEAAGDVGKGIFIKADDPAKVRPDIALKEFLDEYGKDAEKVRERMLGAVKETEDSLATIHAWDRSQGLRKCHSRTVVKTRRTRAKIKAFLMGVDPPKGHLLNDDTDEEENAEDLPPHPPNAYGTFVKENFAKFREANPDIKNHEVVCKLAEAYRELGDEEKKRYKDAAAAAMAKYKEEHGEAALKHYRKSKKKKRMKKEEAKKKKRMKKDETKKNDVANDAWKEDVTKKVDVWQDKIARQVSRGIMLDSVEDGVDESQAANLTTQPPVVGASSDEARMPPSTPPPSAVAAATAEGLDMSEKVASAVAGLDPESRDEVSARFPFKLMNMLEEDDESIVRWLPRGVAFFVMNDDRFVRDVLPRYFHLPPAMKFLPERNESEHLTFFRTQLFLHGFRRITEGPGVGAFHHTLFQRDHPELCLQMKNPSIPNGAWVVKAGTKPKSNSEQGSARERRRARDRARYVLNAEKMKRERLARYRANAEEINAQRRERHRAKGDLLRRRERYRANAEEIKKKRRVQYHANKEQAKLAREHLDAQKREDRALKWQEMFMELEQYKQENGPMSQKLKYFCKAQRKKHKEGTLSEQRQEQLNEIGFQWQVDRKEVDIQKWNTRFLQLQKYNQEHAHCDVPQEEKALPVWCKSQRAKFNKGTLTQDQINQLEGLEGWAWSDTRRKRDEACAKLWDSKLEELKAYREVHGHCKVPKSYTDEAIYKLNRWVDHQRTKQTQGKLGAERKERLDVLGFTWGVPRDTPQVRVGWDARFAQLQQFREEHGHCRISRKLGGEELRKLGIWCMDQRTAKRRGKLSREREELLQGLGFEFAIRDNALRGKSKTQIWQDRLAELKEFQEEHGHCNVVGNKGLGGFVKAQRQKKRKGLLSAQRTAALDELGFDWRAEEMNVDVNITVPPGQRLGLTVQFDDGDGAVITAIQQTCAFRGQINIGDRVVETDGRPVMSAGDLSEGSDRQRVFGFLSTKKFTALDQRNRKWEERFDALRRFGEENGHFNVPAGELRDFTHKQRHYYRKGELSDEKIARFEGIQFDLGVRTTKTLFSWEEWLDQLKEYAQQHGHCDVPLSRSGLGKWVWHQRNFYKKLKLSDERILRLEAAGFDWHCSWNDRIAQLQLFSEKHGQTTPPQNHVVLGDFVKTARQAYRRQELSEESTASLVAIGFVFGSASTSNSGRGRKCDTAAWEQRFQALQQFKLDNGHANAPRSHPELGNWCDYQRKSYKKGRLSRDQIDALEGLGFFFGAKAKNPELSWHEQYNELAAYKAEHGNCLVPQAATGLGRFVHWQRCVYKKGKLSEERVNLLNELGFDWGSDAAQKVSWDERFAQLQRFKEKHGHCRVPRYQEDGLGGWLARQRAQFDQMSEAQRNSLIEMGIAAVAKKRRQVFEEQFARLQRHREEQGHFDNLDDELTKFVDLQRRYHKAGTLTKERIQLFKDIGFDLSPQKTSHSKALERLGLSGL